MLMSKVCEYSMWERPALAPPFSSTSRGRKAYPAYRLGLYRHYPSSRLPFTAFMLLLTFSSCTYFLRSCPYPTLSRSVPTRSFQVLRVNSFTRNNHSSHPTINMSDLSIELTAPNGRKYSQPIGLFINNEWVKSKKGQKITTINPTYHPQPHPPSPHPR
jgi:hypothetical protein